MLKRKNLDEESYVDEDGEISHDFTIMQTPPTKKKKVIFKLMLKFQIEGIY